MKEQEIIDKSNHIACNDATSVSATGLFLQKPFGITYFYSEDGKEWLKTDAAIFANSRSIADIKRIAELEANQERAEKLIFELHEQVYDSEYLDNQVELYEALKVGIKQ
jgi:hypothetical protein